MTKLALIIIFAVCASSALPATSISRWFSSSYLDLRVTLRRFGHCIGGLPPLREHGLNETEYLVNQMRYFLDQANYDNEQLSNVSYLMDHICRADHLDENYPISVHIDVSKYNHTISGKENRCRAIDEALDSMFNVFRRASLNKSEPLDFSSITFYPNATDKTATYNLTDLINTSWIKSEVLIEQVCNITQSIKEYVRLRTSKASTQDRSSSSQQTGIFNALLDLIDRLLDPILGLEKRLYWEGNNGFERVYSGLANQLGNLRDVIGSRYTSTRGRISSLFISASSNSTQQQQVNNVTTVPSQISRSQISPAPTQQPQITSPTTVVFNKPTVVV